MGKSFVTTSYELKSEKLAGRLRLVFLADLHGAEHGPDNEELLHACRELRPDLLLSSGDMVTGHSQSPVDAALRLMKNLAKIAPVYAVNGNHETYMRRTPEKYSRYMKELRASGIRFVNNCAEETALGENRLVIRGLELFRPYYRKFRFPKLTAGELEQKLGVCPEDGSFQILLAHNPQFVPAYLDWGADLTLCGHFHGGFMRLPGGRCLLSPYGWPLPRYGYGHFQKDGAHAIVSAGLGEHTLPFRIANPMELVVIDVTGTAGGMTGRGKDGT